MAQNNRRGRSGRRRSGGQGGNNPNRSIDSQGPEVKIRGNAQQVYDKYTALARDAFSSGDRIRGESLQQHAEHYYRMLQAMKPPEPKEQPKPDEAQTQPDQKPSGDLEEGETKAPDAEAERPPKPKRERRQRREEPAEVIAQAEPAKAEEPSGRAAVEKEGHEGAEATGEDEAKPRRRRSRRRKADEDEPGAQGGEHASEEASAV